MAAKKKTTVTKKRTSRKRTKKAKTPKVETKPEEKKIVKTEAQKATEDRLAAIKARTDDPEDDTEVKTDDGPVGISEPTAPADSEVSDDESDQIDESPPLGVALKQLNEAREMLKSEPKTGFVVPDVDDLTAEENLSAADEANAKLSGDFATQADWDSLMGPAENASITFMKNMDRRIENVFDALIDIRGLMGHSGMSQPFEVIENACDILASYLNLESPFGDPSEAPEYDVHFDICPRLCMTSIDYSTLLLDQFEGELTEDYKIEVSSLLVLLKVRLCDYSKKAEVVRKVVEEGVHPA